MGKLKNAFLVIVVVIVGALASGISKGVIQNIFEISSANRFNKQKLESEFEIRNITLLKTIKELFPSEYNIPVENLVSIANSEKNLDSLRIRSAEQVAIIRRKYGKSVYMASDEAITRIISSYYDVLLQLRKKSSQICVSYFYEGGSALTLSKLEGLETLNNQGELLFSAIAEGIISPKNRREPNDSDWEYLIKDMLDSGVPRQQIEIIVTQDRFNKDSYDAAVSFVYSLRNLDGESGSILRAFIAKTGAEN